MGQRLLRVAIAGDVALMGRDLAAELSEQGFPMEEPTLVAPGTDAEIGPEEDFAVVPWESGGFASMDLVFLLPGVQGEEELVREAIQSGALVVDASGREPGPDVPLIFPGINEEDLEEHERAQVVALPSPAAAQLAAVLLPVDARAVLTSVQVVSLESAAAAGSPALAELSRQTVDLLSGREPEREVLPQRLAFNLIPMIGASGSDGTSTQERRTLVEVERLLGRTWESSSITSIWAPVFHGSTQVVTVETERPLGADGARELFSSEEGLKVLDDPALGVFPMPMLAVGDGAVHVGRIQGAGRGLRWVTVADALRFGLVEPMARLAWILLEKGRFGASL